MTLLLTEKHVNTLLTMDIALEAVEEGFRQQAIGQATNSPRSRLPIPRGALNFMSAAAPGMGVVGFKTYAISRGNPARFYVQLSSSETGDLLALIEASGMSQIRTGAASGIATKYMARRDSSTVGMIGCGYQARSQLEAICRVREIRFAKVFARTQERREKFAAEMARNLGINVSAVKSAEECVTDAHVLILITSANRPVLDGQWLSPGTHINAAGANHWMRRELDDDTIRRCAVVVADDVDQAKIECGDLLYAIERGVMRWDNVHNLSEVIAGRAPARASDTEISLFESQGLALEDIAIGKRVYELAMEKGIGEKLQF